MPTRRRLFCQTHDTAALEPVQAGARPEHSILDVPAARLGLAACEGWMCSASVPPLGVWWLEWIALGVLCLACVGRRPLHPLLLFAEKALGSTTSACTASIVR